MREQEREGEREEKEGERLGGGQRDTCARINIRYDHTWIKKDIFHFGTLFTLPRDLPSVIKNTVRNVHTVLVEPSFTYVALSHCHLPLASDRSNEGLLIGCV